MPALQTKRSNAPYNGMAAKPALPPLMQPLPAPPVQQPVAGQQAQGQAMPGMMPPQPSVAAQAAGMTGGGRQMRGYGNTPLKQNSGTPGTPGRPPAGTKKSAAVQALLSSLGKRAAAPPQAAVTPPVGHMPQLAMPPKPVPGNMMQRLSAPRPSGRDLMQQMMNTPPVATKAGNANCYPMMSMTGPLSGMGPAGVGMKPPTMAAPMSSISGMNSITPNVGAAVKTSNAACCKGKTMKKSVRRIKKSEVPGWEPWMRGEMRPSPPGLLSPGMPTAVAGLGAGMGLHGASLGAGLGGLAGAIHGTAKGNMAEGLGRGVVRGAGTGAGVGIGGLLGGLAGNALGGIDGAALGGLAGAGLGGVGGWNAAGHLMGESSTDKLKKEKDKTDQEREHGG